MSVKSPFPCQHFIIFVIFWCLVQFLVHLGHGIEFAFSFNIFFGDFFSWKLTLIFYLWAFIWLKLTQKTEQGPPDSNGFYINYKANGLFYYGTTLSLIFLFELIHPAFIDSIYRAFPHFIAVFNIIALVMSIKFYRENKNEQHGIWADTFFIGSKINSKIFGEDVKQYFKSRTTIMAYQIFIFIFYTTSVKKNGFNVQCFVHFILLTIYLAKFYWWEIRYFHAADVNSDMLGFYYFWGSLVFIPAVYTFPAAYSIISPPAITPLNSVVVGIFGLTCIIFTYLADYEKYVFRKSSNHKHLVWGKPAMYILAEYKDSSGKSLTSGLLTSGLRGITRHVNSAFELGTSFAFYASLGVFDRPWIMFNILFTSAVILRRVILIEDKCRNKYGIFWEKYCNEVPYKLIPGVW